VLQLIGRAIGSALQSGGEHSQCQLLNTRGFDSSVELPVSDTELETKHQDLKILFMIRNAANADKLQEQGKGVCDDRPNHATMNLS
jgi:hypothetical protein